MCLTAAEQIAFILVDTVSIFDLKAFIPIVCVGTLASVTPFPSLVSQKCTLFSPSVAERVFGVAMATG